MTVTLDNRPRNFLNRQMVLELDELTSALERDRSIRAVVITGGHPRSFITHYDVAEILPVPTSPPTFRPRSLGECFGRWAGSRASQTGRERSPGRAHGERGQAKCLSSALEIESGVRLARRAARVLFDARSATASL
jgi:enoyl-CoA hydratase/carnithine racemase